MPKVFTVRKITYDNLVNRNIPNLSEPINLSIGDILYLHSIIMREQLPWSCALYWLEVLTSGVKTNEKVIRKLK